MTTSQRSCRFYIDWFFQTFECGDGGWVRVRTPDNRGIMHVDAFFLLATDAVARKLNEIRAHEMWLASQGQ